MSKRKRSDGLAGQSEITAGALQTLDIPSHIKLTNDQKVLWHKYSKTKAFRSWSDSDLDLLADLVRSITRAEKYAAQLEYEELDVAMKLEKTLDTLVKRQRIMIVHLQIHPAALHGKSGKQVAQNQEHLNTLDALGESISDPLLARPSQH